MTANRDSDRIIRAWLDLMPNEAPDRAIDSVLHAIDATPQVRRPWWWRPWRAIPMNRLFVALGAAAVIVVAGSVLLLRSGSQPSIGASQTPGITSPTSAGPPSQPASAPSASSPVATGLVPKEVQARWMGENRDLVQTGAGASIVFGPSSFALTQSNANATALLSSDAASAGAGMLRLESADASAGPCPNGIVGVYSWARSATGRILTIGLVRDDCAARAAVVPGTWWHMGCRNPNTDCLGDLDPGTYATQYITPRLAPGTPWSPLFGGIMYTVPAGWANSSDWPSTIKLTPSADYARETPDGPPNGVFHEIYVFAEPAASVQNGRCDQKPDTTIGRTVDALGAWLARQPSLATTTPTPITIGGQAGTVIDITMRASWTKACPGESSPSAQYLAPAGTPPDPWGVGINKGERQRLILLDLGGGHVLGVLIDDRNDRAGPDPARFNALVQQAMPIIQSFTFK